MKLNITDEALRVSIVGRTHGSATTSKNSCCLHLRVIIYDCSEIANALINAAICDAGVAFGRAKTHLRVQMTIMFIRYSTRFVMMMRTLTCRPGEITFSRLSLY